MDTLQGKHITIVGMGRSALGAARLLVSRGARPFVTERDEHEGLASFKAELERLGVPYETGGHSARAFEGAAEIVLSPGVNPQRPPFADLAARGVRVLGELELAWRFCRSKVLAVTGANGKTTTTELVYSILRECGVSVALAGNNATPFSQAVMEDPPPEYIVLEVSSYQLQTVETFRPWIAAVLNVTPDHLERHGSMAEYARVKARIFENQSLGDFAIVNRADEYVRSMPTPEGVSRLSFDLGGKSTDGMTVDQSGNICWRGEAVAAVSDILIPGEHNRENILAALTMARAGGFEWAGVLRALRGFKGVEHRLEPVARIDGVEYINDSKSTNVDSLRVALRSFDRPIVLLAGGRGKGSPYESLSDLMAERVKLLVAFGEDAPRLERAFTVRTTVSKAVALPDAFRVASEAALPGDIVLLSPGCASFDQYANFEERGAHFKRFVHELEKAVAL